MFGKKRTPDVKSLIGWIVAGVLIYAVMLSMGRIDYSAKRSPPSVTTESSTEEGAGKKIGQTVQNIVEGLRPPFEIKDTKEGQGHPAICGQEVTLQATLEVLDANGQVAATPDKDITLNFRIGDAAGQKLPPAIARAVTGMRKGGERIVTLAPELAFDLPGLAREDVPGGSRVRYSLALQSARPDVPISDLQPKAFEEARGNRTAAPAECGDTLKLHLSVYDLKGTKRFDSREGERDALSFAIGLSSLPLGVEQGAIGLFPNGKRTLLLPPAWQRPLWPAGTKKVVAGWPPAGWPFPMNETAIVEIERVP